jgi:LDH2 family malate/lactate/ureidoglycolate dehydrogenase
LRKNTLSPKILDSIPEGTIMKVVSVQKLTSIYTEIAKALGASPEEARIFADCHVRADLRGMYTQGAAIVPYTVWLIEEKLARFGVPFKILRDEAGLALVDAGFGVGVVVGTHAMNLAIEKARVAGTGSVWVQHGGDFNMTANHVLQAIEQDMVGIVMRNENPRVAPWGGRDPFFYTNPIAVGVPTAEEPSIVIDMAAGSFSVGQVVMAARDKRPLPSPHLVNREGVYTDDATEIVINPALRESGFTGAIVTLGHKGLIWALIVELFSGLLAGTNTSNQNDYKPTAERPWDEGAFYMAIDVSKLRPVAEFKAAADEFARALRMVRPAEGFERVIVPGEEQARAEEQRRKEGVPIRDEDWQGVLDTAARFGVEALP